MSKNNSILCGQCESTNTREKREQKTGKKKIKERKRLMDFVWCWNSGHFERGKK